MQKCSCYMLRYINSIHTTEQPPLFCNGKTAHQNLLKLSKYTLYMLKTNMIVFINIILHPYNRAAAIFQQQENRNLTHENQNPLISYYYIYIYVRKKYRSVVVTYITYDRGAVIFLQRENRNLKQAHQKLFYPWQILETM